MRLSHSRLPNTDTSITLAFIHLRLVSSTPFFSLLLLLWWWVRRCQQYQTANNENYTSYLSEKFTCRCSMKRACTRETHRGNKTGFPRIQIKCARFFRRRRFFHFFFHSTRWTLYSRTAFYATDTKHSVFVWFFFSVEFDSVVAVVRHRDSLAVARLQFILFFSQTTKVEINDETSRR